MPSSLVENSGMLVSSPDRIWLHNDSGDGAKLYLIDTFGNILRTVLVQNASNLDWEDITQDRMGNVYIGDFGNNNNDRQNLKIYKIPHPDSVVGTTTQASVIHFYYPEQTAFPPAATAQQYDAEALIYYQDSLYIFTKDRTVPHLAQTLLYQIPADTGYHAAVLLDSFQTNQISYIFEVTAAAISPNNQQVALLGANRIWLFYGYSGNRFFQGTQQTILLQSTTQKEALDFVDSTQLYFSNESSFLGAALLSKLDFSSIFLNHSSHSENEEILQGINVYPNPSQSQIQVRFYLTKPSYLSISLHELDGKQIQTLGNKKLAAGQQELDFNIQNLADGVYLLQLRSEGHRYTKRIILAK